MKASERDPGSAAHHFPRHSPGFVLRCTRDDRDEPVYDERGSLLVAPAISATTCEMSVSEMDAAVRPPARAPSAAKAWLRALEMTAPIGARPARILPTVVQDLAARFGNAPALIAERESFSFRELAARANRYARWSLDQDLRPGDVVCLMMPNRPEYMAIWLGITRVGGIVSLLNTNLAGPSLAHCIDIVAPAHVIVAAELIGAFSTAMPNLTHLPAVWCHGGGTHPFRRIDREIERYSAGALDETDRRPPSVEDRALYIYTSGTTGLPKAAIVDHFRLMTWSHWFAGMMDTQPDDRMYNCLPMYHSIGGVVATGAVLVNGGAVVIREKFSARQFWDDVARFDCTLFQYIGELCRYLVRADPHPREADHRLRLCCGNGLKGDVWNAFKDRFRIPHILEFYAATEGNVSLYNVEGKLGAIGRIPAFLAHRFPVALVKLDPEQGEPVRGETGFCVRCAPNEAGEAIGRIRADGSDVGGRFEGYVGRGETEKKVLRDVFEAGDAWFRTGDLMRKDEQGFFHFVDRIGDTFRWKGENVATAEVAEAIATFPGIADATVYGVAIPGTDGRAGMAALVLDGDLDLGEFRAHLKARLPSYARPLFLRITRALAVTATFKHRKNDLIRDGYDPAVVGDAMYFDDGAAFVPLDRALHARIRSGQIRV
jgi:fatty-acyl-CoA synthase